MPSPIRRVKRREPLRPVSEDNKSQSTGTPNAGPSESLNSNVVEPGVLSRPGSEEPATPKKRKLAHMDNLDDLAELGGFDEKLANEISLMTPPATPTAFSLGKALFQRGSQMREVIGRKTERRFIEKFIAKRVAACESGALYISGLPGTGKSALVTDITAIYTDVPVASINCMTIDRSERVFPLIAKEFKIIERNSAMQKDEAIERLSKVFMEGSVPHILVLDELDHIMTRDQEVLFKLFEWACSSSSNLIIIGIANAIDLTDRFLPRLQAHKLVPQVLAFKPYSTQDIASIIEGRLRSLRPDDEEIPLMHPASIRLCATKTAANSGDLRKAFDICKRAIEVEEEKYRAKNDGRPIYEVALAPKVEVGTVIEVTRDAFGGVNSLQRVQALNFQQKAVLCVLVLTERKFSSMNLTINQVYEHYAKRCESTSALTPFLYPEFLQVVTALEAGGVVNVTGVCSKRGLGSANSSRSSQGGGGASSSKGTEGHRDEYGLRKISSKVQMMDVVTALSNIEPLKALLLASL